MLRRELLAVCLEDAVAAAQRALAAAAAALARSTRVIETHFPFVVLFLVLSLRRTDNFRHLGSYELEAKEANANCFSPFFCSLFMSRLQEQLPLTFDLFAVL